MFKNRVATLVEYSFKEDRSNHDGYSESRRSPEEQMVNGLSQRHVGGTVRKNGTHSYRFLNERVGRLLTLQGYRTKGQAMLASWLCYPIQIDTIKL